MKTSSKKNSPIIVVFAILSIALWLSSYYDQKRKTSEQVMTSIHQLEEMLSETQYSNRVTSRTDYLIDVARENPTSEKLIILNQLPKFLRDKRLSKLELSAVNDFIQVYKNQDLSQSKLEKEAYLLTEKYLNLFPI